MCVLPVLVLLSHLTLRAKLRVSCAKRELEVHIIQQQLTHSVFYCSVLASAFKLKETLNILKHYMNF